jgi:prepilin-type N-terminal cleavage/methylation domain-containing protein
MDIFRRVGYNLLHINRLMSLCPGINIAVYSRTMNERGIPQIRPRGADTRQIRLAGGVNMTLMNRPGYTLIQLLVALALIAIIAMAVAPSILNTLEVRDLENSARDIQTTLVRAKLEAVRSKLNHRVRFDNTSSVWEYLIERELIPGTWEEMPGFVRRIIHEKYNVTLSLPASDLSVVFSPLGFVDNFDINNNSILLQSDKLNRYNQDDEREILVFRGGSIRYTKSNSET